MIDHLEIMRECLSIRRGEHPGWSGDPVLNADTFLEWIGRDMPEEAEIFALDLDKNAAEFSDELGISPGRVHYYANRLRDGIKSSHITAYCTDRADGVHSTCAPNGPFTR